MTEFELLTLVFVDTFTSNLIFVINSELAVWVTQKLSQIDKYKILLSSFLGILFAGIANYFLGIIINRITKTFVNISAIDKNTKILRSIYLRFYYYLIILSFLPIYSKFMLFFAGYVRFRPFIIVPSVTIVKTLYYWIYG